MNTRKSFEMLEIGMNATLEEAKQAYKDLVAVWHPDRFSHNPRLKKKAEEKLKEANVAFETVKAHLGQSGGAPRATVSSGSKTELAAELGTTAVLTLWSFLSNKINHLLSDEAHRKNSK